MAELLHAKDIRPGMTYLDEKGNIWQVIENTFNKTSMAKAVIKVRAKNLRTNATLWNTLDQDKYEKAEVTGSTMTYSYNDGNSFVFMDDQTYESIEIANSKLEWEKNFLIEGMQIKIQKYGEEILGISLPDQVVLEVKNAEEAVAGNSINSASKKAWLITGFQVEVPQFIKTGEKIIVSTIDGKYVGRGK